MEGVRLDKWLWAARFFKTRSLAADAVDAGKVKLHGERVKPAKVLRLGDVVTVQRDAHEWVVTVRRLSTTRGPADVARSLYEEDPLSFAAREARNAEKRLAPDPAAALRGRPTKRDRRALNRVKGE